MIKKNIFSLIIALIILFLSFTGQETFDEFNIPKIPYLDKIVHAGMYFVFMFSLIFENRTWLAGPGKYFLLAMIPFFYGTAIEILQPLLTKNRTGDFFDVCFNTLGVILAILLWVMFKQLRKSVAK
jgi:VanZ family protein